MTLRRYIRAFLIFARSIPYDFDIKEVTWTDADAITAARFFSYGTGQRLLLRLKTGVINMSLEAVQKGDKHSCGVANGASLQVAALENHFPQGMAHNANYEESEQEAALDDFAQDTA